MEPYATAAQPGPLNGNRPVVNGTDSLFNQYKNSILYSIGIIIAIIIVSMIVGRSRSYYKSGEKKKEDLKTAAPKSKNIQGRDIDIMGPSVEKPKAKKM